MKKNYIIYICILLFTGVSCVLYHLIDTKRPHQDIDSKAYIENAQIFAKDMSFSQRQDFPYYALGYSMILGMLYKTCGDDAFWIVILQILLALLSGILMACIAQRLFGQQASFVTFFLMTINLGYLVFVQFILTEILLSFFLLLFLERCTAYLQTKKMSALYTAGFVLGLSIMIKPAALYFPLLLLPLVRLKSWIIFICYFLVPIFGYMAHNKIVFNTFKVSKLDEINLLYWWYPHVLAAQRGTTSDHERLKLQKIAQKKGESVVKDAFKHDLYAQPLLFLNVWLKNVIKTFLGLYTSNLKVLMGKKNNHEISFFRQKGSFFQKMTSYISGGTTKRWIIVVGYMEFGFQIARYLLCLLAFVLMALRRRWNILYLFSAYVFYFSMITGHDGCARFRMMFEGVLIILMAYALVWFFGAERKEIRKGEEHG